MLCENPLRRTGLSTLFHEFISHALREHPAIHWLLFAAPGQPWEISDPRVTVDRSFPGNDRKLARLFADHFRVGPAARRHGADALLTIGFAPARCPLPLVMHAFSLHHLQGPPSLRNLYRRSAFTRGLSQARLVIANSQWTAAQLTAAHGPVKNLLVSPEGIQHDRFHENIPAGIIHAAHTHLNLPPRYVLWSSNFYRYKRAELALATYAALPPELRAAHPLVLIGGDWEGGLARARAEAARLGIAEQTRFLGWIDDRFLPACYRGASAHLLSTAEETFGRSVLEAMACGCPCLLQDLPVLREVAAHAALYTDFTDTAASATRLTQLLTDAALASTLRQEGLARAQQFSFARLARERLAAIRAALVP